MKTDKNTKIAKVSELELRVSLIQHLIETHDLENSVLAAEARYGSNNKFADVLFVNDESHAYEIKSDFDSTSRLEDQLDDYLLNFDYVTLVTTKSFFKKAKSFASNRVGLIIHDGEALKSIRQPKKNKRLSKIHLAFGCSRSHLLEAIPKKNTTLPAHDIAQMASKTLNTASLRTLSIENFKNRYSETTQHFFSEICSQVRETDLLLLRRNSRVFF